MDCQDGAGAFVDRLSIGMETLETRQQPQYHPITSGTAIVFQFQ